ncbi:hypothetical protein [Actinomadura montaniterrae]|uniref:PH domain-containing protein n=1 Tax=Actinomadura montaniterrae TaxID=1803903 RepID=A0A6L3W8L9_9ACTN|nr:hypothetical protein [Actinomadura montaniterrae]KAB2389937.1 hypothetical protein F9B16_01445 [Actinomadura montaniterrae]
MTAPQDELQIAYRSRTVWFWSAVWPVALALRWFLGGDAAGPLDLWFLGIALLEANAVMTALRARRGLTLTAREVIWHKYEMRLSWANVTAVEQSARRDGTRLVVRVGEPDQALEEVAFPARLEVRADLRRFGAPVVLRAGSLARPAAEVVEIAERLRREYEPPSGVMRLSTGAVSPERDRARRSARLWVRLASAGFGVLLAAVIVSITAPAPAPQLTFAFKRTTGPGYMDQTLMMNNYGSTATAPSLTFVPLDWTGHVLPGVTVRTAYGSDRGLVVLPPRSTGADVLAFDGPGFRNVADVRVTVRHQEHPKQPAHAAGELQARRLIGTGYTEAGQDFDTVVVHNTNGVAVSVRLVCILWEDPPPGAAQQMVRSLPIGGLISMAPYAKIRVPVTEPVRSLARSCGSVKVYYSRSTDLVNV